MIFMFVPLPYLCWSLNSSIIQEKKLVSITGLTDENDGNIYIMGTDRNFGISSFKAKFCLLYC